MTLILGIIIGIIIGMFLFAGILVKNVYYDEEKVDVYYDNLKKKLEEIRKLKNQD